MSETQKQRPIMQSRFLEREKEGEGGRGDPCEVFFFSFFLIPSGISL